MRGADEALLVDVLAPEYRRMRGAGEVVFRLRTGLLLWRKRDCSTGASRCVEIRRRWVSGGSAAMAAANARRNGWSVPEEPWEMTRHGMLVG